MKKAKLFKNGQSQAVRLPRECRFDGDEVYVKKAGDVVFLIPVKNSWNSLLESLDNFSDDFMTDRAQPEQQQVRDELK